ncbi:type II toxin-antitoxin system VapC family toxin [Candidatus Palauibacter sp.]|uniref:type II toxin-antitoxin system VapC family toxin n=1 Tax=Candidatus Palauibacter sp. TaxID=3101350 RepID=UPI003AF1E3D1
MIFVDVNVFIHHVGRKHPLRREARERISHSLREGDHLVTSAEVLQELLHFYLRSRRVSALDDAFTLVEACLDEVWAVEKSDVTLARNLATRHPGLEARDLVHLACCIRREPDDLMTFDRALAAAWRSRSPRAGTDATTASRSAGRYALGEKPRAEPPSWACRRKVSTTS